MTITFQRVINGFYFTGLAEVEPAEPATEITPGSPPMVTVWNLHIDDSKKNCIDIIDPAVIQRIEAMIAETV